MKNNGERKESVKKLLEGEGLPIFRFPPDEELLEADLVEGD